MESREELVELVRVGSLEALAALQTEASEDPLVGFALCTDDDVSSLFHVGCTIRYVDASEEVDVRFNPNDWQQTGNISPIALDLVSRHFNERPAEPTPDQWRTARDSNFGVLVEGLLRARRDSPPGNSVFLTVCSTDPSNHMEALEEAAILLLNPPDLVRKWWEWRLHGASRWRSELRSTVAPLTYAEQDLLERLDVEVKKFETLLAGSER